MAKSKNGNSVDIMEDEKKVNPIKKALNKVFNKDDGQFTAEKAWLKSTYGNNVNFTLEERIANKQKSIREVIKSKFRYPTGGSEPLLNYSSYRCVIDIEEDLVAYKNEILQSFIDGGFKVINLSEKVEEIEDENVYLISWKNTFKK